ncbi:MAG: GNAT family N-acetyltransferase [Cyanobacteria bacterium P01_E01_bin.6]
MIKRTGSSIDNPVNTEHYRLQFVDYGSDAYHQAAQLRYQLFYQAHHIPVDAIFNPAEGTDQHLAITTPDSHRVLAYGRLGQNSSHEFQIYQMVVRPEFQGQGLGTRILDGLTKSAIRQGATQLVLFARVTKQAFYQRSGFEPVGNIFPSTMTGVPHIKMQKHIE